MLKYVVLCLMIFFAKPVDAQLAATSKAKYVAILKVVVNYKIGDEDISSDIERLRESERFKRELEKITAKLDNSKNSNATNRRVMRILEQAGKDLYNELK